MSLLEEAFYGAGWDESQHLRHPAGSKEGGQFRTLYHVSGQRNRESISKHGLVPGADMLLVSGGGLPLPEEAWQAPDDGWDYNVWLFESREAAEAAMEKSWGGSGGVNDMWEVRVPPESVLPDRDKMPDAVMVRERILPGQMARVQPPVSGRTFPKGTKLLGSAWDESRHPRHPAGGEDGGRFRSKYEILGTTDEVTTCDVCGRDDLKGTVALRDEEGNDIFCGSDCASRMLGYGEGGKKRVEKEARRVDSLSPYQWWLQMESGVKIESTGEGMTEALQALDLKYPDRAQEIPLQVFVTRRYERYQREEEERYRQRGETAAAWDESQHPRHPAGVREGGRFRETVEWLDTAPSELGHANMKERVPWIYDPDVRKLFVGSPGSDHTQLSRKIYDLYGYEEMLNREWIGVWVPGRSAVLHGNETGDLPGPDSPLSPELPSLIKRAFGETLKEYDVEQMWVASAWDESEHPRWPEGHPDGGKFRPKEGAAAEEFPRWELERRAQEDAMVEYNLERARHEVVKVKVGKALALKEEIESWHYGYKLGEGPDGRGLYGIDPKWKAILDNWGEWTVEEAQDLRAELAKALREDFPSGLLSAQYGREIGRSLASARNQARRIFDQIDKALLERDHGEEWTKEQYPELYEVKQKKVTVDPRSQGVPEVYLSESGKFKPGYDAKLKSDLVNSALGMSPKRSVVKPRGEPDAQLMHAVAEHWRSENPDEAARQGWSDEQLWKVHSRSPTLPAELWSLVNRQTGATTVVESTLLHRFEPKDAIRILEERGWTSHLDKARSKWGLVIREPDADDIAADTRLRGIYGGQYSVMGSNIGRVQELWGEAGEISDGIHRRLAKEGVELYFGPPESTDLDEMWHRRDDRARNNDPRTMKAVAGFYSPSTKRVINSADTRYGSAALAAHEIGHAIGDVLGVDDSSSLAEWHRKLREKGMLGKYYLQNGNHHDGGEELWAEGVALHHYQKRRDRLGRTESYRRTGPFKTEAHLDSELGRGYMEWVAHALKELEEGRHIP